jgi:urease accessory protein
MKADTMPIQRRATDNHPPAKEDPMIRHALRRAGAVMLLALPWVAQAHVGTDAGTHHQGLIGGLIHPFTGVDHLAAMLSVGVWSALVTNRVRSMLVAPLAFATMLLAGALLSRFGVSFPAVEPMIASSLLALGLLVASRAALPPAAAAMLVGCFALFHGAAHGQELAGLAALAGMVIGTAVLHAAGLAVGVALKRRGAWLARATGVGVALYGAALLAG